MAESVSKRLVQHPYAWLVANAALIIFGISVLWYGASTVENITTSIGVLSERLEALETRDMSPETARRLAILETQRFADAQALQTMNDTMTKRLDRIEGKLDMALQR